MSSVSPQHPEESIILRHLDGELPSKETRVLQLHFESCWHCRRERNELQATIDAFVRYRESILLPNMPAPPKSWPDLHISCQDLDNASTPRPAMYWPIWRVAAACLLGLAVLAAAVVLTRQPPPPAEPRANMPATPSAGAPVKSPIPKPELVKLPRFAPPEIGAEVEVIRALHQAGADLGEPIELESANDGIRVKAVALEPERSAQIQHAIESIPGARFQLVQPSAADIPVSSGSPATTPRPLLFASRLREHFRDDAARDEFVNAMIDGGDTIVSRAHAWNKLEERFAGRTLTVSEARIVEAIKEDHIGKLRQQARELSKRLASIFPDAQLSQSPSRPLIRAAQEFDELISAAFAGAQSKLPDQDLLPRLQTVLKELSR